MLFFKRAILISMLAFSTFAYSDEVSKKVCAQFLPALGSNNIDLVINGFKRDYAQNEKQFFDMMDKVNSKVSKDTQERCDKGTYPVMDLNGCYDTCKGEAAKAVPGSFKWNVDGRNAITNSCFSACTGAYVAQNAITQTLRKVEITNSQCGSLNVLDSKKAKQINDVLSNTPSDSEAKKTRDQ